MRSLHYLLATLLLSSACGNEPREQVRDHSARDYGDDLGLGSAIGKPVTIGTITAPQGGTFYDLIAPPVASGTTVVPLKALLAGGGGTFALTTVHVSGGTWPGTPVPAGAYTLTYLDDADNPTGVAEAVNVNSGVANYKIIGGIRIDPSSAVAADRTGVGTLAHEILMGGVSLKTVKADLGTVVDLPMGVSSWTPIGATGDRGITFGFTNGESIVSVAWGSIQVKFNGGETMMLQDSHDKVLFLPLVNGMEYLLPAAPQSEGCRVYRITVSNGAIYTRTLCSDATAHLLFNLP